ncbi:MAG TPA: Crp/Fnr family transcriptional regulator [Gaiellaceae bacterium]|nr:Crp/Fnr family transcriptional regulator [Gaiellaceae bacterium]
MEWWLLAGLSAEEVREVLALARRRRFSRGEVVFHQDDPAESVHLIAKGRFAIRSITPVGDVATIAVRGPGECFGELALVDDYAHRVATVAALEEGETFVLLHTEFRRLRGEHPRVEDALVRFLVNEVRTLNMRLLEALFLPVERRVRRRLVELARLYPSADGGTLITLTQEVIAELAGASRATVNQVLREEEKRGTLELTRGSTRIIDLESLEQRAR